MYGALEGQQLFNARISSLYTTQIKNAQTRQDISEKLEQTMHS